MKKILNKIIAVILILATIISIPPMSVNAAVKIEDNLEWFYTNSHYIKSISIPLDYYNYNAEYEFENDYKKYTSYYLYDTIMLPKDLSNPNENIDMSYKLEYDKSIITIKKIEKNETALAIKPLKKGSTNLKITVSAKGYYPYSITTKINILDKGKLISTKAALNTYFTNAERSKGGYHFVPDVIKELNLKNKSLYEKVLYTSKWCIDNYDDLKAQYFKKHARFDKLDSFRGYLNYIFEECMKELNIPYIHNRYYTLVLMNDDKWYMVNVGKAYDSTYGFIQEELSFYKESLDSLNQEVAKIKENNSNESVEGYLELIASDEAEINELQSKLDLLKSSKQENLPYTLIKAYDKSVNTDSSIAGKELAKKDMLTDPDNTQKSYIGKIPQFTKKKITINNVHSYDKLVKLPLALNGIKSDDITIWNRAAHVELVWQSLLRKKDVYIITAGRESGNVIIEASPIFDTMEVEVICPTIDGEERITINNAKRGSKIKIPLADAKFSDFNIKSENTKIATVSAGGVITAKSKGQTTIILESKTNSKFILGVNIGVEKEFNLFQ